MDRLPAELLYQIFGSLDLPQDTQTLRACSLVCSAWLPFAHDRLFATLKVHGDNARSLGALSRTVKASACFAQAITSLELVGRTSGDPADLGFKDLRMVLARLCRLRYLILRGGWQLSSRATESAQKGRSVISLTKLTLENCRTFQFILPPLLRLVSCDELTIQQTSLRFSFVFSGHSYIPLSIPTDLALSTLTLMHPPASASTVLTGLLATRTMSTLSSLTIAFHDPPEFTRLLPALGRFLAACTSLKALDVRFRDYYACLTCAPDVMRLTPSDAVKQYLGFALRRLNTLRRFSLGTGYVPPIKPDCPDDELRYGAFWEMVLAFVHILPERVEEVELVLQDRFDVDSGALGEMLARLKGLRFIDVNSRMDEEGVRKVRRAFEDSLRRSGMTLAMAENGE